MGKLYQVTIPVTRECVEVFEVYASNPKEAQALAVELVPGHRLPDENAYDIIYEGIEIESNPSREAKAFSLL